MCGNTQKVNKIKTKNQQNKFRKQNEQDNENIVVFETTVLGSGVRGSMSKNFGVEWY